MTTFLALLLGVVGGVLLPYDLKPVSPILDRGATRPAAQQSIYIFYKPPKPDSTATDSTSTSEVNDAGSDGPNGRAPQDARDGAQDEEGQEAREASPRGE